MKKPPENREASILTGRLPTLPHSYPCSTIGAEELNFRVRDGNGWVLLAKVTQKPDDKGILTRIVRKAAYRVAYAVEIMVKPNGQLVTVSSTHYCAYTSVLSNWSSTSALQSFRLGDLILGKVSRLYAFSVYPDRTPLPSDAAGATTGSQEVRPPRSSRTKGRPPQISYAHHR